MNTEVTGTLDGVSLDQIFSLLRDGRRRTLIDVLAAQGRELTLNDVTKEIVVDEAETDITDVSGATVMQVATSLHHVHIPRLAAAGAVEYNATRKLVTPTERLAPIASFLDLA